MAKSVVDLTSIEDALGYWKECLMDFGRKNDMEIAGCMVNLASNDHFHDDWYQKNEPMFDELFDLVASLEVPNGITEIGNDTMRQTAWKRVYELLESLERKYLHNS